MSDIIVTLPQSFGLAAWTAEGDNAGAPPSGQLYAFTVGGAKPDVDPGDRVYVCFRGRLIGYAPLVRLEKHGPFSWALIRGGGAVAVTIPARVPGFRGWRYRWWEYEAEVPFPEWKEGRSWEEEERECQGVLKL